MARAVRVGCRRGPAARAGRRDAGRGRGDPPPHAARRRDRAAHAGVPPVPAAIDGTGRRVVGVPAEPSTDGGRSTTTSSTPASTAEPATLLLLCHPHNPTGHVFTRTELSGSPRSPPATTSSWSATRSTPSSSTRPTGTCRSPSLGGRRRGADGDRHVVVEGVQPRRAALGDPPRRPRRAPRRAARRCRAHYLGAPNLMAVAATEAAWTEGDGWQRAVARAARRQPAPAGRAARGPAARRRLPACPTRRTSPGSTAARSGSATIPPTTFRRRGVELSPGPAFGAAGRRLRPPQLRHQRPASSSRSSTAMATPA